MSVVSLVDETREKRPLMGLNGRAKDFPRVVSNQSKPVRASAVAKNPSKHETQPRNPAMPPILEQVKPLVLEDTPKKLSDYEIMFGTPEVHADLTPGRPRPSWATHAPHVHQEKKPRDPVIPPIVEQVKSEVLEDTTKKIWDKEMVFGTPEERDTLMPEQQTPSGASQPPHVFHLSPIQENASSLESTRAARELRGRPGARRLPPMTDVTCAKAIVFVIICCLLIGTLGIHELLCWFKKDKSD